METLILHIPKVYERRNLLMGDYTSIDHIYVEDGKGGGFIAAETFMTPEPKSEAIVVNYQSDEVTFFNDKESKFINQLLKRKIPFEPLEIRFVMEPNKKNHQSKRK
ncbi:hypothetical protein M3152_02155 [Sporosarcina luteola]|uniref:hypothetical protein n=1 Tax=Bacillales TaxID=1385 RepID=UPI00203E47F1|nr:MULTISPECIES: hypothetical protein [Bacillales]MCM3636507.1 hypothetical protein [Sporosarcina luteola]